MAQEFLKTSKRRRYGFGYQQLKGMLRRSAASVECKEFLKTTKRRYGGFGNQEAKDMPRRTGQPRYDVGEGTGVPQDYEEAARWLRKAGDQGHIKAQYKLGALFIHGEGVSKTYKQAAWWFRKSADQEHAKAQCNLGSMYWRGKGVF
jgi:TPR repeat protein